MQRFSKHVSVVWDLTCAFDYVPALPACHSHIYLAAPPPAVVPMAFGLSVEQPAIIAHPQGFLLGDNKLTSTVYHNHVWFALGGHDLGKMLMHVCVPPLAPGSCTLMTMDILLSSRKAKFTAGEVKADGVAVACCTMIEPDSPAAVTPMMICGTVPVPAAGCGTSVHLNSLLVGMSFVDLIAGWVDVLITVILSLSDPFGARDKVLAALGFSLGPDFGDLAGNLIRLEGQYLGAYHGDATFDYKPFGGPFVEFSESVTFDGASGDVIRQTAGSVGVGGVGRVQSAERSVWRSDGTGYHEISSGFTGLAGAQDSRTIRSDDGVDGTYREVDRVSRGPSLPWSEGTEVPFL